jgi:hypothetical protein
MPDAAVTLSVVCCSVFRCGVLALVVSATSAGGASSTWVATGCGGMVTAPQVRTAAEVGGGGSEPNVDMSYTM